MKPIVPFLFFGIVLRLGAQTSPTFGPLDARHWGVILDDPELSKVVVKKDVVYWNRDKEPLHLDIYQLPVRKSSTALPAVIFLNAIGEQAGEPRVKDWEIYRSWPRLIATQGMVGISMESDGTQIHACFQALFDFLQKQGNGLGIDANRLGVYAASANVTQAATYLMKPDAFAGIKAAVLYYGGVPAGPYRKDLPLMFVIAEGDVRGGYANLWSEVLKNNAPWTIRMGTGMPHGFDAFEETDEARKVVKQTISFWQDYLQPMTSTAPDKSQAREILSAQYGHDDKKLIPLLEKWFKENPEDSRTLFTYAAALKNEKRYGEAEVAFRKVLAKEPENAQALTYLYLLMHELNRPDEAPPFLAAAEKTGRMNKYMYQGMGYTMYSLGKYNQGIQFFEKAVSEDPSANNLYNLACGYARVGDKEKAISYLRSSIAAGFTSFQHLEADPDLESLHADDRYKDIVQKLKVGN